ncbi:hypothetical protein [Cellvibrio fibrivorans]|uniref:Uncharacterized protein n=1 Tax=Cellvibrio fibrivorans TaxID=126350 RepID=A0ABU1V1A0_9GAMM|nr:hypothetical protein [Cellvibrio fibrivorans]MDR7091231.1 hypothetical protein [Cellvibrio fibrivorans]
MYALNTGQFVLKVCFSLQKVIAYDSCCATFIGRYPARIPM